MNWINRFFLRAVLLPRQFYDRLGVDTRQLTAILTAKLLIDDRRPNTFQVTRQKQYANNKEIKNATIGTMVLSAVMGLVYLFAFMFGNDFTTHMTVYFGMFILMLCMMLVSDFTSVLIDVKDNYIILPKPVNDSTVVVARLLHVFIHICKLVLPMTLPGAVYLGVTVHPAASPIFFVLALLATLLSIFLINAVYIAILRVTTPERFKSIISYFQIVFAIAIYASSQILPRMMEHGQLNNFNLSDKGWMVLAPPYWFACALQAFFGGPLGPQQWIAAALGVLFPLLSIYLVVKFLAPAFNQKLAMLTGGEGGGAPVERAARGGEQASGGWIGLAARLLSSGKVEETGFLFTWKMMARSREFKIKVYPSMGYLAVIVVLLLLKSSNGAGLGTGDNFRNATPVMAAYFCTMILIVAVGQVMYSERFKASWMFFITPVAHPGHILSGALKAVLMQFYFFIALAITGFGLWLAGPAILPNLLLAIINQVLICYAMVAIGMKQLPFSQPVDEAQKGGQFLRGIGMLFIGGLVGGVHMLVFRYAMALAAAYLLAIAGIWLLIRNIKNVSWQEMKTSAEMAG